MAWGSDDGNEYSTEKSLSLAELITETQKAEAALKRLTTGQLDLLDVQNQLIDAQKRELAAINDKTKAELKLHQKEYDIKVKLKKEQDALATKEGKEKKEAEKRIKQLDKQLKAEQKLIAAKKEQLKYAEKLDEKAERQRNVDAARKEGASLFKEGLSTFNLKEAFVGAKEYLGGGYAGGAGFVKGLDTVVSALGDLSTKLDKTIEEIVRYKSDWDTRLFGNSRSYSSVVDAVKSAVGASPYVKESDVMKNLNAAIDKGIAYNVEQRAFLKTVSDDIAKTFDAFDSTLLQIIRVQQSDSTAARLGMEASLNQYLNSMFDNTEYLSNLSGNVTQALYEATSLLSSRDSIGFEYQVQKWLGSLYSVGMSSSAVSSIADALGKLASGDISATTSGTGKLLVMAASQAGLNYSDLLTQSLNDADMNKLMKSMVVYLEQIANSNKVVQTQYAQVYGLSTSDIIAAKNLASSIGDISKFGLSYEGAMGSLDYMLKTVGSRMSLGEKMSNILDNFQYTIAAGIAENPAMYALWQITDMMNKYAGGINLPTISVMGTSVDLEATVSDLMRVGLMGASLFSGIGGIIGSLGEAASGQGLAGVLSRFDTSNTVTRGRGLQGVGLSDETVSSTSYVGSSSSDIYDQTMSSADDQKKQALETAQSDEDNVDLPTINESILSILDYLKVGVLKVAFADEPSLT